MKAYDANGSEIKRNDIVKIIKTTSNHSWLRVGNTLRVSSWDNRNWFGEDRHVILFLKSKNGSRYCQTGIHEKNVIVINP